MDVWHILREASATVCSFYRDGQYQSLDEWNEQQVRLSRFLYAFFCIKGSLVIEAFMKNLSDFHIFKNLWHVLSLSLIMLMFASCSGDEPSSTYVGSWYGTRCYYNPVGGTKWQYITVELYADNSGYLEYEAPTSITIATFVWKVKGEYIECNGVSGNSAEEATDDFSMKMKIEGDRLIPVDKFNVFILTKDNSVVTDGDGNEIVNDSDNGNDDNTSTTTGTVIDGLTKTEIERIVKQNVTVKASYSDYMWHFLVESTLAKEFPNHNIAYGIGHGDVNGNTSVSVGNQAYSYSSYKSGDKLIIEFYNPFWFYYIYGITPTDKETWSLSEMYYNSYVALKDMGLSNLTKDEKDLYNNLVIYLNKYESTTKYSYTPSIQAVIDDKYFFEVGKYSR